MNCSWKLKCLNLIMVLALSILLVKICHAQVRIINIIPKFMSGEINQDSEPNLAVNPANPNEIVASAFTPSQGFCGTNLAPIFVSSDGGNTWSLNCNVPSNTSGMTSDITVRFSSNTNNLYAGILRRPGNLRLNILRTNNYLSPTTMRVLVDRNMVDQPYVQAITVADRDRVYVGNNDFNVPSPNRRTASIDQSFNANASIPPGPTFNSIRIESRGTGTANQDGPPIRPAIHPDGTVYAIFYGWRAFTGSLATTDVIVIRDDNGGMGATPFTDLIDSGDGRPGIRVVQNRTVPWANFSQVNFGQERFVGSNISIAVDPKNSSIVYIAWADGTGPTNYTLHVRRSTDKGVTWSRNDLRTIKQATNPALAINSNSTVGFLYQQLGRKTESMRWVTHIELTNNAFSSIQDYVLANVPANTPPPQFIPYIGDYVHLMTVGPNFYGIFSANNTPDNANFPNGVVYQRNANFTTRALLNKDNLTPVDVSIDPFFFLVEQKPPEAPLFEYAAKVICGFQKKVEDMRLARGFYATAINIHNPNDTVVEFRKKIALTYPMGKQHPGKVSKWVKDKLGPDEALEIDCMDIKSKFFHGRFPAAYIKGFVIIQSHASLDVIAVYTTATLDKEGNIKNHSSIEVEKIHERQKEIEIKLPDLIPVPDQYGNFCRKENGRLVVIVMNQGLGQSAPSKTEVDFFTHGKFSKSTRALDPGSSTKLYFDIPRECGHDFRFRISVDVMTEVSETNEGNNVADGTCIG